MYDALRVDDEKRPLTGSVILTIYSIKARDCSFHLEISEERKMQLAISAEGQVAPDAVYRDAEEFGIQFLKLREELVIERRLISADWTPIRRVKKQDDRMPAKVA